MELCDKILELITELKRAIILNDECETFSPKGEVMAQYASIEYGKVDRFGDC